MIKNYIARKNTKTNKEQPLCTHLHNVADLMSQQMRFSSIQLASTAQLIGLLHDLGKYTTEFQRYIRELQIAQKGKIDHSTAGGQFLLSRYDNKGEFAKLTTEIASMAIFSHHTGLLDFLDLNPDKSNFVVRANKENILSKVDFDAFFQNVVSEVELDGLFDQATREIARIEQQMCDIQSNTEYFFSWGMIVKLLFSVLIDADRLDSAEFEAQESLTNNWNEPALWCEFANKLNAYLNKLVITNTQNNQPQQSSEIAVIRQQISNECKLAGNRPTGIYQLSVPTGSGKTLSSLRFALQHALKLDKKRIIIVIPYTTIIDQTAREIRSVLQCDDAILEHHCNVVVDEDNNDNENSYSSATIKPTERWDVPIVITTQVQFLDAIFSDSNTNLRRLQALTNSVIIFDEIQSLPIHCTYLFNLAVNFLRDFCNTTALLCTATQPNLNTLEHPIRVSPNVSLIGNIEGMEDAFRRVQLVDNCVVGGNSAAEVADLLLQYAKSEDVLCVVNTTKQARELFQSVSEFADSEKIDVYHLSTRMCPAHRMAVLETTRRQLQISQKQRKKILCVSTPLIEAGVDISFPRVFRAITGLPSIAQTAGRCNRHGELNCGYVHLIDFANERLGSLLDVKIGQQITRSLIADVGIDELLSGNTMQAYFERYYDAQNRKRMAYPMLNGSTMLDLLAGNDYGIDLTRQRGDKIGTELTYGFRSAGREFNVIKDNSRGVLVPYDAGKELIEFFEDGWDDINKTKKMLRKAQRYSVPLFEEEIKCLFQGGKIKESKYGILVLADESYDEKIGVVLATKCEPQSNMNFDVFCRHVQTKMEAKVGIDILNKP